MPPTVEQQSTVLLESLQAIRRRVRALSVLFGLGVVLAAAVGLLLATVLLDYLLNLPVIPRVFFMLIAAGGIVYTLWNYVLRPLAARFSVGDVAGRLENAFPQFDDRLRSTVDFVRTDLPGSPIMKQRVVSEAATLARNVDLGSALIARPVVYSIALGLGAVLLAVLLGFANRDFARIALSRLLVVNAENWPKRVQIDVVQAPPAKIPAGQRIDLRMRLAKGGDRRGVEPIVYYRYDNGPVQRQVMTRNSDGTFSVAVDARGDSMELWMKAGDDQTEPARVDVVQRLAIAHVNAAITPPPYAKLPPATMNLSQAPATMTLGSTVELQVTFNKPLAEGHPVLLEPAKEGAALPPIEWDRPAPATAVARLSPAESLRFRVRATDIDYFENAGLEEFQLIVRPDQSPTVLIELPRRNEDRTAVSLVRLEALAEDDFDISTMTLMVDRIAGQEKKHWEIPLEDWSQVDSGAGERRRFRVKYDWELSRLQEADLKAGDVLEYYVQVTDNYDLNGAVHEPVTSGKLRINIISQETLSVQISDAMRALAERVRQVQNAQNRTRQETTNLRDDTQEKPDLDRGDLTALARLGDQQGTIASQTKQLAGQVSDIERRMEENRSENAEQREIAREVRSTLLDTAERPMSEAARRLGEAARRADPQAGQDPGDRQPDQDRRDAAQQDRTGSDQRQTPEDSQTQDARNGQPEAGQRGDQQAQGRQGDANPSQPRQQQAAQERNQALEQSADRQQEASDQLEKVLEKMGNPFDRMIEQVRNALAEQQRLSKELADIGKETIGRETKDLTPEQRKQLEQVAEAQRKAAEKTEKLTQELSKAAEQLQKSDQASSQALEQAARQSQQQQVSPNQSQAAQAAQQNQQAQAQARQNQAELGLQLMLDTLREAERRKLEQLARELSKLQDLILNLVRRQAGHNIDNLRLQGQDDKLALITDELLAKAERIRDRQPPQPEPPQLTSFQIQTERNSRDVSKTADELSRGGADISALLTRAAGQMERAIVSLREAKLPAALDPSQIAALEALEEALRKTDEAAAQVAQQMDQANRETIRQALEKIRADQELVNKETERIDTSRLPDGALKRVDAVRLGQLPGEQGTLADRTKELEEPLQDLGGIVYVWANKDIVDTMNDVKADLARPATGRPTQAEQARILAQLDAMIKNLSIRPMEREFHGDPGGGEGAGAGQGQPPKPRLPTEAEIRLLKWLQVAINDATKKLNEEVNPDKPKLVALGNRQGELRGLLDQLLQKASDGEVKLGPEPDPKERLPEEAGVADIENQEFDEWLLGEKPGDEQMETDMKLVGQRMARSRQRLALDNDPGKTTQLIQERILLNLDHLAQMARQQQAQMVPRPGQGQGQQAQRPQQGQDAQPQNAGDQQADSQPNAGQNPAGSERLTPGGSNNADLSRDIRESASEWGHLTPRERQAIIDGANDTIIRRYERITRDYYEMMSRKGSQER